MTADRPIYVLTLRPLPGPIPDAIRLRRLLKLLLRALGLRCITEAGRRLDITGETNENNIEL